MTPISLQIRLISTSTLSSRLTDINNGCHTSPYQGSVNSAANTPTVDKHLIRHSSKVAHCAFKDICTHVCTAALTLSSKQVNQSCFFCFFFPPPTHDSSPLPSKALLAEGPFRPAAIILFRQLRALPFSPSPPNRYCVTLPALAIMLLW